MTFIQKNPNKREKNNIEIVKLVQKGKKKKLVPKINAQLLL